MSYVEHLQAAKDLAPTPEATVALADLIAATRSMTTNSGGVPIKPPKPPLNP